MATHKDLKSKTEPGPKQRRSRTPSGFVFPSNRQRLPLHIPGTYQVAMGTSDEIVTWLRSVPREKRAILILFQNDASYRIHGPIFWHVAQKLPEIVARVRRRRFDQLVDALTKLLPALPGPASAAGSGARVTPVKRALPRRRRGHAE